MFLVIRTTLDEVVYSVRIPPICATQMKSPIVQRYLKARVPCLIAPSRPASFKPFLFASRKALRSRHRLRRRTKNRLDQPSRASSYTPNKYTSLKKARVFSPRTRVYDGDNDACFIDDEIKTDDI